MRPFGLAALFLGVCLALAAQAPDPLPIMGINVEGTEDWGRMYLFADAMKQSRGWGCPNTPWDLAARVDADGWPIEDAGVVVLSNGVHIGGTYRLSFTGVATVRSLDPCGAVRNAAFDATTNTTRADLVVDSTARKIMLSFTGTRDGVRDVRLLRPGCTTETFTPQYLDLIRPYACLRLNAYARTNGGFTPTTGLMVSEWADRTLPTHATQNRRFQGVQAGGAWEHAIDLANFTDKDLWVCLPDLATDDYVRRLATLLRDRLEPERCVYVEWSNELWNTTFAQTGRNMNAAVAEVNAGGSNLAFDGSTNQATWAWRRVGRRIVQISDLFRSVYGDTAMMTRVRPVLAMQSASPVTVQTPLEYIDRVFGAPRRFLYAVAEAPYFGLSREESERTDLTVDQIFARLPVSLSRSRTNMRAWTVWARYYGLRHLAYEGGPHLVGAASLAAKIAANRDERMGSLIEQNLRDFYEAGGDQFEYFCAVGAYDPFGMFGTTDDLSIRDTVKTRAIGRVLAAGRPAVTAGFPVPGTINAADASLRDWCTFVTSDPAGGSLLGSNCANGAASYLIRVSADAELRLIVRVGSRVATGRLEVLADNCAVQTVAVPNTGSMVAWRDVPAGTVHLCPGLHVIRLRFATTGFDVKSLSVGQ